ncbi:hypothetical protein E8E13_006027 [Curvularia kusanoi]|uniref:Uncharacterized protein n=1 Tax=Curvularia kusanoi TaxID=90978 RepID=A0A9P4TCP7_CURKU|nr:hypothetical protein E8E13_006027 [Curvularia kusanoi]
MKWIVAAGAWLKRLLSAVDDWSIIGSKLKSGDGGVFETIIEAVDKAVGAIEGAVSELRLKEKVFHDGVTSVEEILLVGVGGISTDPDGQVEKRASVAVIRGDPERDVWLYAMCEGMSGGEAEIPL